MNRPIKILLALAALGALFLGFYLLRPPPPLPPLPQPNGCDDFVKAGKLVEDGSIEYRTLSPEKLRSLVSSNATALRLIREGLKHECRVPTEFSTNYINSRMLDLPLFKRLSYALVAEGRLAEMEGRTNDAVRAYLETIHFSHEFPRGGTMIDKLVGLACETIGTTPLQKLVLNLNAKECREAGQILETIDAKSETVEEVLQQERKWARQAFTWRERIAGLLGFKSIQASRQSFVKRTQAVEKQRRTLLLDLAARAYELENSERPKSFADLVPSYLKAIPQDPLTGTNLLYYFR